MRIEVFHGNDGWFWHFRNKGRITADSEAFPTKAHAVRAAKAVVVAVFKRVVAKPVLVWEKAEAGSLTIIVWSA